MALLNIRGAVVIGLTAPLASTLSVPIIVPNWFEKSGTFVGVALAFTGIGSAIMVPLLQAIMDGGAAWSTVLMALGVVYAAVIALCGILLVRFDPAPLGLAPVGTKTSSAEAGAMGTADAQAELPGFTYKQMFKSPAFYLIFLALALVGYMAAINSNANIIVQNSGFTASVAALVVSCMAVGNIIGKLVLGAVRDKFSGAVAGAAGGVFVVAGILGMLVGINTASDVLMYAFAFICGLGSCLGTMAAPLYAMDTFGPKEYGVIYGTVALGGDDRQHRGCPGREFRLRCNRQLCTGAHLLLHRHGCLRGDRLRWREGGPKGLEEPVEGEEERDYEDSLQKSGRVQDAGRGGACT